MPAERRGIGQHHRQGQHRHRAIHQRRGNALGQDGADIVRRTEPRDQIANMAFLEIVERQPYQVLKQAHADTHGDHALHVLHDESAQRGGTGIQHSQKAEADRQRQQQARITFPDGVVDHQLHEEWTGQNI